MPTKNSTPPGPMLHIAHAAADRGLAILLALALLTLAVCVHRPMEAFKSTGTANCC
jgi:hypothetical protein